jgi:hypothetical protein
MPGTQRVRSTPSSPLPVDSLPFRSRGALESSWEETQAEQVMAKAEPPVEELVPNLERGEPHR